MENNQDKNKLDIEEELDKNSEYIRKQINKKEKKSFFDIDFSWIVLIVLGLAAFGITYALQQTSAGLSSGYVVLYVLVVFALAIFIYNLGKFIFAGFTKYKLVFMELLGFSFVFDGKQVKTNFEFSKILEAHLLFNPKDQSKAKPALMLFGGTITYAVVAAVLLILSFSTEIFPTKWEYLIEFGAAIGSIVPIYELIPLKYTNRNDMYTFIVTQGEENRLAYNNYLINKFMDLSNQYNVPVTFENYNNSRIKPWTFLPLINKDIYENKLNEADKLVEKALSYSIILSDSLYCEIGYQKVYLLLVTGKSKAASEYIVTLEKRVKSAEDFHPSISALRSDVLVSAFIENSLDSTKDSLAIFKKKVLGLSLTDRSKKEIDIVNNLIVKINLAHPDWKVEKLDFSKKDTKENSFEEDDDE